MAGLGIALWTLGANGFAEIFSIAGRVGPGGFIIYCAWSLGVFGLLGGAWLAAAPGEGVDRLPLFAWARMVREAAADMLPFSQLGGIVLAARTLGGHAVATSKAYGAMVVDMTTEMAAQLVFTLFGLSLMASLLIGDDAVTSLRPLILGGTGVMVAIILGFFLAQRWVLDAMAGLAGRFVPGSAAMLGEIRAELEHIYTHRLRVVIAFVLNLAAWVGSGIGAWIVLRFMEVDISVWSVLSLESLIFTLRGVAFAIPGGLGVQEAAYALAGPLFGLPAETALALSLAKRARDVAIGLPTLIVWQLREAHSVRFGLGAG